MKRTKAYPIEVRQAAVNAVIKRGRPLNAVSLDFQISLATLKRWLKIARNGEDLTSKRAAPSQPRVFNSENQKILKRLLEQRSDWFLRELKDRLAEEGIATITSTVHRTLGHLGYSLKKNSPSR